VLYQAQLPWWLAKAQISDEFATASTNIQKGIRGVDATKGETPTVSESGSVRFIPEVVSCASCECHDYKLPVPIRRLFIVASFRGDGGEFNTFQRDEQ
jgi:hypothetical protein